MWKTRTQMNARRRLGRIVTATLAFTGVVALAACDSLPGSGLYDPDGQLDLPYPGLGGGDVNTGGGSNPFSCPNGQYYGPPVNNWNGPYGCHPQADRPAGFWVAMLVLQVSEDCNSLVGGGAMDAKAVLWNVAGAGRITQASAPSPEFPNAIASAGPLGSGVNGHITLYPKFNDPNVWANENATFPRAFQWKAEPTMLVWQGLTLLHEVGHLTGANNHGRYEGGVPFDSMLLDRCFGLKA
jgi:hypothetical protein